MNPVANEYGLHEVVPFPALAIAELRSLHNRIAA